MNATTITEQDIKALRKSQSKAVRLTTLIMIPLMFAVMVVVGGINLYFCSRFSDMAGMSMVEVIRGWFAGIDTSAQYSGMYLKAMERWETSIMDFTVAGFAVLMFVVGRRASKRNARILRFIEEKGI
jgi:hypothetical protein